MRNIWTIAKRELNVYFNSSLAYAVALAILLITGIIFALNIWFATQNYAYYGSESAPDTSFVTGLWWAYLFLLPTLTMRLIADEQRMGTIELILTAPIRESELVIGKWLGAFLFMLAVIMLTLVFPIIINTMVSPGLDIPVVFSGYLGLILFTGALLALGTGISSLFTNQFTAFFVTQLTFIVIWFLIGAPAELAAQGSAVFQFLDMSSHFNSFQSGVINLIDVSYFLSVTALGLFVGASSIEIRRWS